MKSAERDDVAKVNALNGGAGDLRWLTDDIATPDDLEAHRVAMEEYANGESVPSSAINWD